MPIDPKKVFGLIGPELTEQDICDALLALLISGNLNMEAFMTALISALHSCCALRGMELTTLKALYQHCLVVYSENPETYIRQYMEVEADLKREDS